MAVPTRIRRSAACAGLALSLGLALAGCTQQRALHVVEQSGERAAMYGNWSLAAAEYGEVVERRPGRWDARIELGRALLELDRPAEAREQLEVAYNINPSDDELLELLVTAMLASGDVEAMTRELNQRAQERGETADWMRLGLYLQRAGDFDNAERALLTAAAVDKGASVQPQMALAGLYREIGDDERAIRRLRMALHLDPENTRIREAIRSYGEVPGPTFSIVPDEQGL